MMNNDDLISKIIKYTKSNKLKWKRNYYRNGIIFNSRINIDGKKKLILKVYMHNELRKSFIDIKMSNGIIVKKIYISDCSTLYNLMFILDYETNI